MKKILAIILAVVMMLSVAVVASAESKKDQVYICCSTSSNDALYINHDFRAFEEWGEMMGVTTKIIGPTEYDDVKLAEVVEEAIAQQPAGLLINGVSDVLAGVVNKAVAAGINVVLYDGDVDCDRHGWVGTDWYNLGRQEAKVVAEKLGGKGKVAYMGVVGNPNMELGFSGFLDYLADYPEIEIVGKYDDEGSPEKAAENVHNIVRACPDVDAICGFDYPAGLGMGPALLELGLAGSVVVVTTDWEEPQLAFVKDGVYTALIGQKRELFTYYGATMLYEAYNNIISWGADLDLNTIPYAIDAGTIVIDSSNIDQFFED